MFPLQCIARLSLIWSPRTFAGGQESSQGSSGWLPCCRTRCQWRQRDTIGVLPPPESEEVAKHLLALHREKLVQSHLALVPETGRPRSLLEILGTCDSPELPSCGSPSSKTPPHSKSEQESPFDWKFLFCHLPWNVGKLRKWWFYYDLQWSED